MVVQLRTLEDDNLDFKISDRELQITVLNMIKSLHGDFGAGAIKTCFKVRYCNPTTRIIIFKTRHGPHQFLSSVIPFINKLQEKQIQLSTLYTGASMFQCYKFIQNYQKDLVRKITDTISEKTKEKMLNITNVLNF
ncbi:ribonuclease P/MRP protein subunit POP5 isoform X2 [Acyrthosiphon pisum]|nr:ribonuclease P/MRP protein subunit POP5 isoform X2 [Acyrthosiphon pisum]XP_060876757.1 ribonuclease P/MRP protein subunit POP5 isoform X2 [Metopolophium dirhodum]|eukprot:XP_008185500.1 PREDICTED: ribonuclease P/MRP protein subunit POP5 isoform X2 [Acyrthosiphon pisum]